jgi:NADPH-dependent 2,4-dienoyl-CoA reductase/sulfur reductase-like enzyme
VDERVLIFLPDFFACIFVFSSFQRRFQKNKVNNSVDLEPPLIFLITSSNVFVSMASPAPKIVIIGAGFAGMWAALSAARKRELAGKADNFVEIVLVAPEPTLYIRPRLYENDVSGASAPLADLFAAAGVRYVQGLVLNIDVKEKLVGYASADGNSSTLSYDRLILASGSTLFRPQAVAGLAEYSFDADQMESALKLDVHLKSLATLPDSPSRNTVVVCGGGFTGTYELLNKALVNRRLNRRRNRIRNATTPALYLRRDGKHQSRRD